MNVNIVKVKNGFVVTPVSYLSDNRIVAWNEQMVARNLRQLNQILKNLSAKEDVQSAIEKRK